jgi:hypothetical protein
MSDAFGGPGAATDFGDSIAGWLIASGAAALRTALETSQSPDSGQRVLSLRGIKSRYPELMTWARKFAKPIALKDGRAIATLGGGRELMLSLPPIHRRGAAWRYAAELLNEAAAEKDSVTDEAVQLTRAQSRRADLSPRLDQFQSRRPLTQRRGSYFIL